MDKSTGRRHFATLSSRLQLLYDGVSRSWDFLALLRFCASESAVFHSNNSMSPRTGHGVRTSRRPCRLTVQTMPWHGTTAQAARLAFCECTGKLDLRLVTDLNVRFHGRAMPFL